MPDIRPFRGIRYDMAQVGTMSDVVAPPYDVIDSALPGSSSTTPAPTTSSASSSIARRPTTRPSRTDIPAPLASSRNGSASGVLREDPHPAYYLYSQTFEVEGQTYTRKGFLARVRLEPFGSGRIYPHEHTLSGPKADRLALFNATKYNLSPIFGLYPDDDGEVIKAAEAGDPRQDPRRRRPTTSA